MIAWLKAQHDKLKGYRTLIACALMAVIDVLDQSDLTSIVPPSWRPYWFILQPMIFAFLRVITKGPVGVKV